MIIYILTQYHDDLHTPIEVYFKFFEVYGNVDWDNYAITTFGLVRINEISTQYTVQDAIQTLVFGESGEFREQHFQKLYESLGQNQEKLRGLSDKYSFKSFKGLNTPLDYHLNIIDPLMPTNNLGRSISNFNSKRIKRIITNQYLKYKPILAKRQDSVIKYKQEMLTFFDKMYVVMGKKPCETLNEVEPKCKIYSSQINYPQDPYGYYSPYANMEVEMSNNYYNNMMYTAPGMQYQQFNNQYGGPMQSFQKVDTIPNQVKSLNDSKYDSSLLQGSNL